MLFLNKILKKSVYVIFSIENIEMRNNSMHNFSKNKTKNTYFDVFLD